MTGVEPLDRPVRAAAVAELAWRSPAATAHARPVTPLQLRGEPAIALTYAHTGLARELAAAPVAALVLSDPRMGGPGWRPLAVLGRLRLIEDPDGSLFTEHLLVQELRKYPPSRALADSALLRRENWWYLPRLVLTLDVAAVVPVAARTAGEGLASGQLLAVAADPDRLYVDTVAVADAGSGRLRVTSLSGRTPPAGAAALLGHDFSAPDLERWTPWLTRGALAGGVFEVGEWPERTALEPPPGLWQRLRRHRDLQRACQAALAAAGR